MVRPPVKKLIGYLLLFSHGSFVRFLWFLCLWPHYSTRLYLCQAVFCKFVKLIFISRFILCSVRVARLSLISPVFFQIIFFLHSLRVSSRIFVFIHFTDTNSTQSAGMISAYQMTTDMCCGSAKRLRSRFGCAGGAAPRRLLRRSWYSTRAATSILLNGLVM